jgi:hypothetical protein
MGSKGNREIRVTCVVAVTFAREHPLLRRSGQLEPARVADSAELLALGSAFIANYIHRGAPGTPSRPRPLSGRPVRPVVPHLHLDCAGLRTRC